MQRLQFLIDTITKGRNLHISILDLCGILHSSLTAISFQNIIHSKRFCDLAKSTPKGYRTCLRCKMLANTKAIETGAPFCGSCLYGLREAAFPVVIRGSVAAIVYVGNAVICEEQTVERLERTCRHTGVDPRLLGKELAVCERPEREEELLQIAELVADYVKRLAEQSSGEKRELHWLVALMKLHAEEGFADELSLGELAVSYQKNEKYLGRLFKKEMGVSYHAYGNQLRLQRAERMLAEGNDKIIDVALSCGYNHVSYFNRVFQKKHGMSPRAYREAYRKHGNS